MATAKVLFRSQFERKIREWLEAYGYSFKYEPRSFALVVKEGPSTYCGECGSANVVRDTEYTPDFHFPDTGVWMEAKGKFDARARKIALAMKAQHPNADYRILLQRDNWMTSKKAQRYSEWLQKRGIPYAVGKYPPVEWVTGAPGISGQSSGEPSKAARSTSLGKQRRKC